ncbi:hypothetical protein [Citrobacter pasteurii]|nr:hypothetical protein [Citrobacter pasteurii]
MVAFWLASLRYRIGLPICKYLSPNLFKLLMVLSRNHEAKM